MGELYEVHGLRVAAPFALGRPAAPGDVDLDIVLGEARAVDATPPPGEVVAARVVDGVALYTATGTGNGYVLRMHGLCDFVLDDEASSCVCHVAPGSDLEVVALVGKGALLSFVLGLRGAASFHAAAVDAGDKGVLFVGDSGMGKSTLAAVACRLGAALVADDLVRVDPGPPVQWRGTGYEVRLRAGAAASLGHTGEWERRISADGRVTLRPPATPRPRGSVDAVIVPRLSREANDWSLERLGPVDAMLVVSAFPRLLGWQLPRVVEVHMAAAASLADTVPVVVATVPWGDAGPDGVREMFAELGVSLPSTSAAGAGS